MRLLPPSIARSPEPRRSDHTRPPSGCPFLSRVLSGLRLEDTTGATRRELVRILRRHERGSFSRLPDVRGDTRLYSSGMRHPAKPAHAALSVILTCLVIGWVLFLLSTLSDVLVNAGHSTDELWGPDTAVPVRPSTYLILVAIAVFTAGGLLGRRRAARVPAGNSTPLARSVLRLSTTITVIGIGLAAWSAVSVFFTHFLADTGTSTPLARSLGVYLPIALYTGIVIAAILIGFVFTDRSPKDVGPAAPTVRKEQRAATADSPKAEENRRPLAWAYSTPILAAATALILGLIIYDITQTALEAWVWVIIQVIIGAGVIAGTYFAARASSHRDPAHAGSGRAATGARLLAHVLSIVFTVVVAGMSLGYGARAINMLQLQPSLSLSAYTDTETAAATDDVTVSADGSGLQSGTDATIVLEPGQVTIAEVPVERDGTFWAEETLADALAEELSPGDYRLTANATTAEGAERSVEFRLTIADDGSVSFPNDPHAENSDEVLRVSTPSISWLGGDLLPSAAMLLLVLVTLRQTLILRAVDAVRAGPLTADTTV